MQKQISSISAICLSSNEQTSKEISEKFTNQKTDVNGLFTNSINNIYYVACPRWPNCSKSLSNTVISDAIIIGIDSLEEYSTIELYLKKKETVSCLIFWSSSEEIRNIASTYKNSKFFDKTTNFDLIREYILSESNELSNTIRKIFDTLDTDKMDF